MIEFRWIRWDFPDDKPPPFGAIGIGGDGAQFYYQVLQYRERERSNVIPYDISEWSEWKNT